MDDPNAEPPTPRRHRFSFSLRTIMLLTLFIGGMSAYFGKDVIRGLEEQAVVDQVSKGRTLVRYAHEYGNPQPQLPGNPLLRSIFGQNYMARVHKLRADDPIGEETIVQLPKLRELDALQLGPEKLSDRSVDALVRIPKLRALIFTGTEISPQQLRRLAESSSLIQLVLDRQSSTDAHLSQLKHFPQLESISLSDRSPAGLGIPTTDAGIASLVDINGLRHLSITFAPQITDKSLEHIGKFADLRFLDIVDTSITNQGVAHLVGMKSLESLRLDAGPPTLPLDVEPIWQRNSLDNLNRLELRGKGFDDQALAAITPLPKLEMIHLAGTSITDAGLAPLKACPALARINLSGNSITQPGVQSIGFLNDPQVHPKDYYERKLPTETSQP